MKKNIKTKKCNHCQKKYTTKQQKVKYCDPCKKLRKRKQDKIANIKHVINKFMKKPKDKQLHLLRRRLARDKDMGYCKMCEKMMDKKHFTICKKDGHEFPKCYCKKCSIIISRTHYRNNFKYNIVTKIQNYKIRDIYYCREYTDDNYINFDWVKEQYEKNPNCHYCKCELKITNQTPKGKYNISIDRINNNLAHFKTNCVLCCYQCQIKKGKKAYLDYLMNIPYQCLLINER